MKSIARLNVNQTTVLGLVAILGLAISSLYPSPLVNSVVLLISILAISGAMPSEYSNLRIVLSFAYVSVGFVLYLVIRGFFPQKSITNADFIICMVALMMLAILPKLISRKDREQSFRSLGLSFLSGSTALAICISYSSYLLSK